MVLQQLPSKNRQVHIDGSVYKWHCCHKPSHLHLSKAEGLFDRNHVGIFFLEFELTFKIKYNFQHISNLGCFLFEKGLLSFVKQFFLFNKI